MKAADVYEALVGNWTFNLWNPGRCLAARNNWMVGHEADLIIVQRSGFLYEVEIKVSVSDFRNEFKSKTKIRKHELLKVPGGLVKRFYYAMPVEVYEKVKDEIPEYAGVIVVREGTANRWKPTKADFNNTVEEAVFRPTKVKEARNLPARKLTNAERQKVYEIVYYAYWKQKEIREAG